jgi:hypothetical protein
MTTGTRKTGEFCWINMLTPSSGAQAMAAKPKTIDEYLAPLSADKRAALDKLRKTIRALAQVTL